MSHSDSPTPSVRSNAPRQARTLAIAACLILGVAAVSVRAVVVNGAAVPQTDVRTRSANASRAGTAIGGVASNVATPTVVVAPVAAGRVTTAQRRGVESPTSPIAALHIGAGHAPIVTPPTPAATAVPSAIARPAVFAPSQATLAASTPASAAVPPGFRRAPLDWRALVSHPGVTFGVEEITDASAGSSSFTNARSLRTHSNIELTLDMDSLVGWRGLTIYAQHKSLTGRNGSGEAAFVQSFSNIDADRFRAMGEVWVEQRVLQDRVSIKAGRIDFNNAFAGTDNGAAFLNASMGFSPSIVAAPTFPLPTWGVEATVSPWSLFSVGVGVFDGRDGAPAPVGGNSRFQIVQANQQWSLGGTGLMGHVGLGGWRHTGLFSSMEAEPDTDPAVAGTSGWYATLDQTVWHGHSRDGDADNHASIGAFAQYGTANPNVQSVHAHHGGGLTLSGLLAARPADVIGVGLTHASWGTGRETIGELFYQLPVTSHLSLVADVQRVRRLDGPGLRAYGNVATMRTVLSF
jgi:porin